MRLNVLEGSSGRYSTSQGTDIHYISYGNQQGPLAICLHGLGGSTETFRPLVPFIPSNYHVVAVDLEGFGKTPLNRGKPLTFAGYVSDLHDLITYLQKPPTWTTVPSAIETASNDIYDNDSSVLLIGHSLGAIISLHFAAHILGECEACCYWARGGSLAHIPPAQQRMRDLSIIAREKGMDVVSEIAVNTNFPADRDNDEAHVQTVRDAVSSTSAETYAVTAELIASDEHVNPDYQKITCPTIFVAGDKDVISPPGRSESISAQISGPSEVVVAKSGHQMILQDLDSVKAALAKLMNVLSSST
ncbi:hypothetical protein N7468_007858 [Penicillium chermesinum]|uniref:AB hydrolase-1 domain-containing protein n=1 Tax=Penicillium chermesinum TaxID=63820 RepID=A0A9W9NNY9_9EURO|nr:uncharacterized protein N7468_007858 [Penicillium chermesinum]KAJ5223316.1 hypothetical protein N7468_007858 [Penicillium chermesinum]